MTPRQGQLEPIRRLLAPASVALVGVSDDNFASNFLRRLTRHGYAGRVYPVNPKRATVGGMPCFPSVADLPAPVDTAFLVVPRSAVIPALGDCARAGIPSATVIAAGFAEAGDDGRSAQAEIESIAGETGMRVLGPNGLGFANFLDRVVLYGSLSLDPLPAGAVALITQSGGLGTIVNRAGERAIGFSHVVSTGNEADIEAADVVMALLDDPRVRTFALILEGIKTPSRFVAACEQALARRKPVVVLKSGQSPRGRLAAMAHTAKLAGSSAAFAAICRSLGVVLVQDIDEIVEWSSCFSKLGRTTGLGLAAVGASGGASIIVADKATEAGLELPDFSPDAAERVETILEFTAPTNPLDLAFSADVARAYGQAVEILADDPRVDHVAAIITPPPEALEPRARVLVEVAERITKPLLVVYTGPLNVPGVRLLEERDVPVFAGFTSATRALASWIRYCRRSDGVPRPTRSAAERADAALDALPPVVLDEAKSQALIRRYGIATPPGGVGRTVDEAVAIAARTGYPVVAKIVSPDVPHKTEAGGVRLGIRSADELRAAVEEISRNVRAARPDARLEGVLVQRMIEGGIEVLAGVNRDEQFGPMLAFGLGGIWTEVIGDLVLRPAPLAREDALEMLGETKAGALLRGLRNRPPADTEAVVDVLLRLSTLVEDLGPRLLQLDINPLVAVPGSRGAVAVDALVVLRGGTDRT